MTRTAREPHSLLLPHFSHPAALPRQARSNTGANVSASAAAKYASKSRAPAAGLSGSASGSVALDGATAAALAAGGGGVVVSADVLERLEKLEELVKMIPALQKKVTGCHCHHRLLHLHRRRRQRRRRCRRRLPSAQGAQYCLARASASRCQVTQTTS